MVDLDSGVPVGRELFHNSKYLIPRVRLKPAMMCVISSTEKVARSLTVSDNISSSHLFIECR